MKALFLSILSLFLLTTHCMRDDDLHHNCIVFKNNSKDDIYVKFNKYDYPDTTVYEQFNRHSFYRNTKVKEQELSEKVMQISAYWEDLFSQNNCLDTLMVFIFNADKVEAGASLQEAVIARYDVSLEDLRSNNWMLSYPPNDNMASIKMWPFYASYEKSTN